MSSRTPDWRNYAVGNRNRLAKRKTRTEIDRIGRGKTDGWLSARGRQKWERSYEGWRWHVRRRGCEWKTMGRSTSNEANSEKPNKERIKWREADRQPTVGVGVLMEGSTEQRDWRTLYRKATEDERKALNNDERNSPSTPARHGLRHDVDRERYWRGCMSYRPHVIAT